MRHAPWDERKMCFCSVFDTPLENFMAGESGTAIPAKMGRPSWAVKRTSGFVGIEPPPVICQRHKSDAIPSEP